MCDRLDEKDQTEREQHYGKDIVYAGQGRFFRGEASIPPHAREVSQLRLTRSAALEARTAAERFADKRTRSRSIQSQVGAGASRRRRRNDLALRGVAQTPGRAPDLANGLFTLSR